MFKAMRKTSTAYFFGDGRILARTHKLNITAFFLFHPNSNLKFETMRAAIRDSSMSEDEKVELIKKFDGLKDDWRKIAIETVTVIDQSLSEDEKKSTDSQNTLVTQTTKLVIGGRTYASEVSTSQSLDISDEIARYERFSFAEFVKCKFSLYYIKISALKIVSDFWLEKMNGLVLVILSDIWLRIFWLKICLLSARFHFSN